jgi:hypothetical protein
MPTTVFLTTDLMSSSRLLSAATGAGLTLHLVGKAADLPAKLGPDCRLVLIDLTEFASQVASIVATAGQQAPRAQIVAFGPHVDEALLEAARAAGCHQVLSRGQFHQQYGELLKSAAN